MKSIIFFLFFILFSLASHSETAGKKEQTATICSLLSDFEQNLKNCEIGEENCGFFLLNWDTDLETTDETKQAKFVCPHIAVFEPDLKECKIIQEENCSCGIALGFNYPTSTTEDVKAHYKEVLHNILTPCLEGKGEVQCVLTEVISTKAEYCI